MSSFVRVLSSVGKAKARSIRLSNFSGISVVGRASKISVERETAVEAVRAPPFYFAKIGVSTVTCLNVH